jgi:hypothetical protein
MTEKGIRRNIWIHNDNKKKLDELKEFYGSNYSAVINMMIAERYMNIFSEDKKNDQSI